MSSIALVCPNCGYAKGGETEENQQALLEFRRRRFRNQQFRLKMLSYLAMTIAMIGAVPMVWAYTQSFELPQSVNYAEHWGVYPIAFGFIMYVVVRGLMIHSKKKFRAGD